MKKVIFLSMAALLVFSACSTSKNITIEEAKIKAASFINENLMQPGSQVSVKEVTEEAGLYKVVINLPNDEEYESYITKDGTVFFPQAMNIAEVESTKTDSATEKDAAQAKAITDVPKVEKPNVELFVMSHCPYGTQIEKGFIPAIKTIGDKIDYKIKFVDYAMHGEKELNEELRQYCIQEEQNEKYLPYLECFLEDDDYERCLGENNINKSVLDKCITATDSKYKVMELFADKSTWSGGRYPQFNVYKAENEAYGVQGSPTFVINGTKIQAGRDASSLLTTICAGFENVPEECNTELSSAAPAPGFGWDGTGTDSSASCN